MKNMARIFLKLTRVIKNYSNLLSRQINDFQKKAFCFENHLFANCKMQTHKFNNVCIAAIRHNNLIITLPRHIHFSHRAS